MFFRDAETTGVVLATLIMPGATARAAAAATSIAKKKAVAIYRPAAIEREIEAIRTCDRTGTQNNRLYIAALKIEALLAAIGQAD